MKYARHSPASIPRSESANPRPETPLLVLCRGCGSDRMNRSARCARCGGSTWETLPARSDRASGE